MTPLTLYAVNLAAVVGFLALVWLFSLILKDSSIVDITWGLGFILIAWLTYLQADGHKPRGLLLAVLVTLWGVRLALHIGIRNFGKGEDFRYQLFRRKWGRHAGLPLHLGGCTVGAPLCGRPRRSPRGRRRARG